MIDSEVTICETPFGLKVRGMGVSLEVANTVSNYLRARQLISLIACGAVSGSLRSVVEYFEEKENE